ncbi:hypothetical protein MIZ01_1076 [Sideroxyarcus emersonii]|uniref:Uncharacterized protein n=1 Tax=Sideroxyarcus emersonii TaxID=2764705 RepID=A0AAN1X9Q1_9PROT|nr:hypothetical protein MIZ01_1076 [Sideroxyarcus emersonii]
MFASPCVHGVHGILTRRQDGSMPGPARRTWPGMPADMDKHGIGLYSPATPQWLVKQEEVVGGVVWTCTSKRER